MQNIFVYDIEKSIERALDTLNRGAESIRFTIENETIDVTNLLEKLPLENVTVYFNLSFLSIDFVKKINAFAKKNNTANFLQSGSNRTISQRRKLV